MLFTIDVNGTAHSVDVQRETPLLWVLRDKLDLKGSKFGCGVGSCGACTVHIDGSAARACVTPVYSVVGRHIATIESVSNTRLGLAIQTAWLEKDVAQCGYCQAGQIMAATALLSITPKPSDEDIDGAMVNACRCGTYVRIREAIKSAAGIAIADTREV